MSVNIMDLVKGAVTDQVMGQLGGLLGQGDQKKTSSLFESAAASILGGLMSKAGTQQGAQQVFEAVGNADDSILDKLGDLLGGGEQTQQIQQRGSGVLDMVFGNQQSGIVDSLARALGLDKTMIGKLLMMAAPIVMSVVGRHVKSKALDMVGFGNMLNDQKQHLGNYLPEGMGANLGLSDLGSTGQTAVDQVAAAANDVASGGGSLMRLLVPLILLGALAYGAFQLLGGDNGAEEAMQEEVPELMIDGGPEFDTSGAMGATDFGNVDFGSLGETGEKLQALKGQFTGITDGFKGLSDQASAIDLKDKLQGLTGSVGDMGLGNFPDAAKSSASGMISKFGGIIQDLADKVENPALKAIVQPAVDALLAKLQSLGL